MGHVGPGKVGATAVAISRIFAKSRMRGMAEAGPDQHLGGGRGGGGGLVFGGKGRIWS